NAVLHLNDDGLVHLVARHVAASNLAVAALEGCLGSDLICGLCHQLASSVFCASVCSASVDEAVASSFFAGFFLAFGSTFTGSSTPTGVARIPSSRSRMTV